MRDYNVARNLLSFLEFLFWMGVVIGLLIAFLLMGTASRGYGAAPGLLAALPGLALALFSLFGVASTQMGRAGVDSAEYGQQALKVARDQLEISKQAMKESAAFQNSFADLIKPAPAQADTTQSDAARTQASYATEPPLGAQKQVPYSDQLGTNAAAEKQTTTHDINGRTLTENPDGTFKIDGRIFENKDSVKEHLRLSSVSGRPRRGLL